MYINICVVLFTFQKPILPPPPGSGRDRSSRNSDSSSVFSPKTPHTNTGDSISDKKNFTFSQDFSTSHEDHSSGDWFAPSANINIFTEPSTLPVLEPTKDEKHEKAKQEIMSQFDVFTELDPLGNYKKNFIMIAEFIFILNGTCKFLMISLFYFLLNLCRYIQDVANKY